MPPLIRGRSEPLFVFVAGNLHEQLNLLQLQPACAGQTQGVYDFRERPVERMVAFEGAGSGRDYVGGMAMPLLLARAARGGVWTLPHRPAGLTRSWPRLLATTRGGCSALRVRRSSFDRNREPRRRVRRTTATATSRLERDRDREGDRDRECEPRP
jgi:hypothetical protein